MASTSASAEFYASFQSQKTEVSAALEDGDAAGAAPRLAALRAKLTETRASLPPYDQRQYDLQLKELEARLSTLRAADKPKSKFAFKRSATPKSATPTPVQITPVPTPSPVVPSPALGTTYTVSGKRDTRLTPADYEPAAGSTYTLTLEDLEDCVVDLRPTDKSAVLTSLHFKGLKRCLIIAPPMTGSVMLSDLSQCALALGAQQFRLHNTTDSVVLLHVLSLPVIEGCQRVSFGPYPATFGAVGESKHDQVQDFDWVREGPSPNWSVLPSEQAVATAQVLMSTNPTLQSIPCIQHHTS